MAISACSIDDCNRKTIARGYCTKHYQRWKAHGDPTTCLRANETPNGAARDWLTAHAGYEGDSCLIWPFAVNHRGYAILHFGNTKIASRAMCTLAHGEPPTPEHQAAHSCGNGHRACVNPQHLRWATQTVNMKDQIAHGTRARGERHGRRKLEANEVLAIRRMVGRRHRDIAADFGVSRETVGKIIRREKWQHI